MGKNGKRKIVVDTDVVIDHLRQLHGKTLLARLWKDKDSKLLIAGVSLTELYIGKSAAKRMQEKEIKKAVAKTKFVPAEKKISKQAGILLRKYQTLRLADALVAATAMVKKAKLCTFNLRHFRQIEEISIYEHK